VEPTVTLPERMPERRPDLEIAEFDHEFIVFDPDAKQVHLVEGFLAIVFDACDGATLTEHLLGELADALPGDQEPIGTAEVEAALAQLGALGLLTGLLTEESPRAPYSG
jgi:hypothetical protein